MKKISSKVWLTTLNRALPLRGKNRNELFDLDRQAFFAAIADAQKSAPDKEVSGKFLRPGQGHAQEHIGKIPGYP